MTEREDLITPAQAQKTLDWLAAFMEPANDPRQNMLATFARCCLLLNEALAPDAATASREADVLGRTILARGREELNLDPLVLAAHYIMLADAGIRSQPLHDVLERVVAALLEQPDEIHRMGRVRHTVRLLRDAGFSTPDARDGKRGSGFTASGEKLLSMPIDAIVDLLDHATADRSSIDGEAAEILSLITLAELRSYHIDLASKVLRMMIAAGCANHFLDEAVTFVALQRASNGSYGFFDPFKNNESPLENRALLFHLPVTLNAVWLLHLRMRVAAGSSALRAAVA